MVQNEIKLEKNVQFISVKNALQHKNVDIIVYNEYNDGSLYLALNPKVNSKGGINAILKPEDFDENEFKEVKDYFKNYINKHRDNLINLNNRSMYINRKYVKNYSYNNESRSINIHFENPIGDLIFDRDDIKTDEEYKFITTQLNIILANRDAKEMEDDD